MIKNDHQTIEVSRIDFTGRKVGKIVKTDEGYLTGEAAVAKIGILTYVLKDGSIRKELVTEETLFNKDSMSTLHMKPITNLHPKETLLNSKSVKRRKVGFTGENTKRDSEFLVTSLTITDHDAVDSAETEKRLELSPGYTCQLLMEPGTFKGERYDAIQLNRKYNHVAMCDLARGGRELRLNLDSIDTEHIDGFEIDNEDAILTSEKRNALPDSDFCFVKGTGKNKIRKFPAHDAAHVRNALARLPQSNLSPADKADVLACLKSKAKKFNIEVSKDSIDIEINIDDYNLNKEELTLIQQKGKSMAKFIIDNIDYEADPQVINYTNSLAKKVDSLTKQIGDLTTSIDKKDAEIDNLKTNKEELQAKVDGFDGSLQTKIDEGVKLRTNLINIASKVLKKEDCEKIDSMSNQDIKKAVILTKAPKANLDDKNEAYIDARFDGVIDLLDFDPEAIKKSRQDSATPYTPHVDKVEKAKNDSEDRILNAYKTFGEK